MTDTLSRLGAALADRYRLDRELGQGGMATVYLAQDLRHDRKVAIKVLRPDLAASLGAERFLREIQIASRLQHPHILPLLDSGASDGFLYYVMPFVEGASLRERLAKQGELPVADAIRIVNEVADALAHAHARGVVHRDIKPDNVLMSGKHALVTDFGVAKALSEASGRSTVTTAGVALGTPAYMAPEQATADPMVDQRADIYALGAVAYELLTGQPPFVGHTPQQVLVAHVTESPRPLRALRPVISEPLEAAVLKCLAKRPADRFQTADELQAVLEPLATPSGGTTPAQTRPVIAVSAPRRTGLRIAAGAAAVLAIVALGIGLLRRSGPGAATGDVPRMVVLPPRYSGPEPQAYVAEGVVDDVNGRLVGLGSLEMIGRTSADRYRAGTTAPRQIGEELDADYVLAIRVTSHGSGYEGSATAELLRAESEAQLWTRTYSYRSVADLQAAQQDIATGVAQALALPLSAASRGRLASQPTANDEAYDLYLRARQVWANGSSLPAYRRAAELFTEAVALDSGFAEAWAGLSGAQVEQFWFGDPRAEVRAAAKRSSERALALKPGGSEVHAALAMLEYHGFLNYPRALEHIDRAIAIDSSVARYHETKGYILRRSGRMAEAAVAMERAVRLDPVATPPLSGLAQTYTLLGRFDEAKRAARRALSLEPTDRISQDALVWALISTGDSAAAAAAVRTALKDGFRIHFVGLPRTLVGWLELMSPADRDILHPFPPLDSLVTDTARYYTARALTHLALRDRADASMDSAALYLRARIARRSNPRDAYLDRADLSAIERRRGRPEEALRLAQEAVKLADDAGDLYEGRDALAQAALAALGAGKDDLALEFARRYVASGPSFEATLRYWPELAPLRQDPRIAALVR